MIKWAFILIYTTHSCQYKVKQKKYFHTKPLSKLQYLITIILIVLYNCYYSQN